MLVSFLAVVAAVGVVILAARLFTKWGRGSDDRGHDGTTSKHTGAMLSALFLMAFAIAVVVPWTTADAARQNTHAESAAIVGAYWSAAELPAPAGPRVQAGLRDYVRFVIGNEWDDMRHGRLDPAGSARLDALRTEVVRLRVRGGQAEDARIAVLDQFQAISAARSQRGLDAKARPPSALLYLTVLTGLATVVFPFLVGARPRGMTMIPLGVMAALLGLGVYLTFDISHVFSGGLQVKPDAFSSAQQEFPRIPVSR
jgi:protein-S-isoprenylcysteine O-methyltransferase Ste14